MAASAAAAEDDNTVSEIVVTAQRREQSILDVPVSVQAFSGNSLKQAGIDSVDDLSRISSSVQFTASFSPSSSGLIVRGVNSKSITGYQQGAAGVIIDGVPVVNQGEFVSDLNDIQRIEILRGPQGTLFGKNATAGVLNIVQQAPAAETQGSLSAGYTTDDEVNLRGMANLGADTTWLRVTGFYRELKPLFENVRPGDNDIGASQHWGLQAKLAADVTPTLHALLTAGYHEGKDAIGQLVPQVAIRTGANAPLGPLQAAMLGYTPQIGDTKIFINTQPYNRYDGSALIGELAWTVNDQLTITSITGRRSFNYATTFDIDSGPVGVTLGSPYVTDPVNGRGAGSFLPTGSRLWGTLGTIPSALGEFDPYNHIKYWSEELRANYSSERFDIVTGVFYQTVDVDGGSGTFLFTPSGTGAVTCNVATGRTTYCLVPGAANRLTGRYRLKDETTAAFADVSYHFNPTLTAFVGLRYTEETVGFKRTGRRYMPTSGAFPFYEASQVLDPVTGTWLQTPSVTSIDVSRDANNWSGRAGVQYEPTPDQNYYLTLSRGYKGPAVDVDSGVNAATLFTQPEVGEAVELGTKLRLFDGRALFNVAVFKEVIKDVQVSTIVPGGGISTRLFNAGDQKMTGVEVEARWDATEHLSIDGGASWLDAKLHSPSTLVNGCYDPFAGDANCLDRDGAAANGREIVPVNGHRPTGTSEWRYTINLNYKRDLSTIPFKLNGRVGWVWQSEQAPALTGPDPLSTIDAYGLLDASVSLTSNDGRWDITLYGKNLTDELVALNKAQGEPFNSRMYAVYGRDFHRYAGLQVTIHY